MLLSLLIMIMFLIRKLLWVPTAEKERGAKAAKPLKVEKRPIQNNPELFSSRIQKLFQQRIKELFILGFCH